MMYKVKATLGQQTRSVTLERKAPFSEAKSKLEAKFGCPLTLSFRRADGSLLAVSSAEQFEQALHDAVSSGAHFLQLECSGPGGRAAAATATAAPAAKPVAAAAPTAPVAAPTVAPTAAPAAPSAAAAVFCPQCGAKLPAGSRFCASCGSSIGAAPAPAAAKPTPAAPATTPTTAATPMCPKCGRAVSGNVVKALDKHWHEACFVCKKCGKSVSGNFHAEDGFPVCKACYEDSAERCAGCGRPLSGSYVVADGGKAYHVECFVCAKCGKPLEGSYLLRGDGKPICPQCARQQSKHVRAREKSSEGDNC